MRNLPELAKTALTLLTPKKTRRTIKQKLFIYAVRQKGKPTTPAKKILLSQRSTQASFLEQNADWSQQLQSQDTQNIRSENF